MAAFLCTGIRLQRIPVLFCLVLLHAGFLSLTVQTGHSIQNIQQCLHDQFDSRDGPNAIDPGMSLLSVHLCTVPGGQIQWFRQLMLISSSGLTGFSVEYTTFSLLTPLFFSS